jgi:hypothetical protein
MSNRHETSGLRKFTIFLLLLVPSIMVVDSIWRNRPFHRQDYLTVVLLFGLGLLFLFRFVRARKNASTGATWRR